MIGDIDKNMHIRIDSPFPIGLSAETEKQSFNVINMDIQRETLELLPAQMIRSQKLLPLSRTKRSITLAMADPSNHQQIEGVRLITGLEVIPILVSAAEIETAIRNLFAYRLDPAMEKAVTEMEESLNKESSEEKDLRPKAIQDDAPIIRMVYLLLKQAVAAGSSDVHVEPQADVIRVRFRVDGELYPVLTLPKAVMPALVSRLKIMAGLDIAERRIPQDGRFQLNMDSKEVDFRISTLPTSQGEKAAIRVLDKANMITGLDGLGLSEANVKKLRSLWQRPSGLVLVTGSTGSGKTTTLYALLQVIDSSTRNIITLEDPVEYSLPGISQVQINPKAGMDFTTGLGSILRQDPDIIMVGEIRDQSTARLAVRAALTGHLVLSTLHTNSAAEAIARLVDMGIEPFLLASALNGVVAQRLLRRLCQNCRQPLMLEAHRATAIGIPEAGGTTFYTAPGCNMCRQMGYRGRIAVQEVMLAGPALRQAVYAGVNADQCQAAALLDGMITVREDALAKARQGQTSLEEVIKAVLGDP